MTLHQALSSTLAHPAIIPLYQLMGARNLEAAQAT